MDNKGFTIIEMLVVISIMVLLTSLLILYSRTGENQIILFRDQARLIAALNRAKSLSAQLFSAPEPPCSFGVHFSQAENNFLIFRDLAADCQNSDNIYTGAGELFEKYQLSPQVKFGDLTLTNIVFIPPDPKTLIDNDPDKIEATITLQNLNGNASLKVKVNNAGQITTQ
ncbi:MAG: prepilin-type N-terminal cleavage/methylation domain-containing protein [bacterium]|nr:prepilin-type N-terminal cleavage/methylation domain-containing protein [bacterium]